MKINFLHRIQHKKIISCIKPINEKKLSQIKKNLKSKILMKIMLQKNDDNLAGMLQIFTTNNSFIKYSYLLESSVEHAPKYYSLLLSRNSNDEDNYAKERHHQCCRVNENFIKIIAMINARNNLILLLLVSKSFVIIIIIEF